jgi:hypothetical protein
MAGKLPLATKLTSTADGFRPFLNERAFGVRTWYQPIARQLLAQAALGGTVRLILDGTKVGDRIAWRMVFANGGSSVLSRRWPADI